jgi:hypothetical protein
MRAGIIAAILLVVLIGGTVMGIASLVLLPLVGIVFAIVLVIWLLQRRSAGKPPIR